MYETQEHSSSKSLFKYFLGTEFRPLFPQNSLPSRTVKMWEPHNILLQMLFVLQFYKTHSKTRQLKYHRFRTDLRSILMTTQLTAYYRDVSVSSNVPVKLSLNATLLSEGNSTVCMFGV